MKAPFLVFVPTAVVIAEVNGNVNRTKMLNVKEPQIFWELGILTKALNWIGTWTQLSTKLW